MSSKALPDGWVRIPIEKLRKASWNYKVDNAETMAKLVDNLGRNGQVVNLIVRTRGAGWEVVNGNHRLEALRTVGAKDALCYDLGKVPLAEAKRVAVETNETSFPTDHKALSRVITSMTEEFSVGDLATTMPYSEAEVEAYRRLDGFDWGKFPSAVGSGKVSIPVSHETKERIELVQRENGLDSHSDAVRAMLAGWSRSRAQ